MSLHDDLPAPSPPRVSPDELEANAIEWEQVGAGGHVIKSLEGRAMLDLRDARRERDAALDRVAELERERDAAPQVECGCHPGVRWPTERWGKPCAFHAAEGARDAAYAQRNMLVGALSKLFPAWLRVDASNLDWPVVMIQLPTGQVSWHITEQERYSVFAHLEPGDTAWDGHDDVEKWRRVAGLRAPTTPRGTP
jgi:hypothetical protein